MRTSLNVVQAARDIRDLWLDAPVANESAWHTAVLRLVRAVHELDKAENNMIIKSTNPTWDLSDPSGRVPDLVIITEKRQSFRVWAACLLLWVVSKLLRCDIFVADVEKRK